MSTCDSPRSSTKSVGMSRLSSRLQGSSITSKHAAMAQCEEEEYVEDGAGQWVIKSQLVNKVDDDDDEATERELLGEVI